MVLAQDHGPPLGHLARALGGPLPLALRVLGAAELDEHPVDQGMVVPVPRPLSGQHPAEELLGLGAPAGAQEPSRQRVARPHGHQVLGAETAFALPRQFPGRRRVAVELVLCETEFQQLAAGLEGGDMVLAERLAAAVQDGVQQRTRVRQVSQAVQHPLQFVGRVQGALVVRAERAQRFLLDRPQQVGGFGVPAESEQDGALARPGFDGDRVLGAQVLRGRLRGGGGQGERGGPVPRLVHQPRETDRQPHGFRRHQVVAVGAVQQTGRVRRQEPYLGAGPW